MDRNIIPTQEEFSVRRKTLTPTEEKVRNNAILSQEKLIAIMKDTIVKHRINDDDYDEAVHGKFRTRDKLERFTLIDCLGKVDEEIWTGAVTAALNGMFKTITNSQTNGEWKVMDMEVDVREDDVGDQHILMGIRWVDMLGEQDQLYRDGAPAVNVTIDNALPEDLLEVLKAQAQSRGEDPELKMLLKLLTKKLLSEDKPPQGSFPEVEDG